MDELKKYKKKLLKLFYISIKNDLDKWNKYGTNFKSPLYNKLYFYINDEYINIEKSDNEMELSRYRFDVITFFYFPLNIKACIYVRKVRKYLNKNRANKNKADNLKEAYSEMESHFIKHVRKEKLENLK